LGGSFITGQKYTLKRVVSLVILDNSPYEQNFIKKMIIHELRQGWRKWGIPGMGFTPLFCPHVEFWMHHGIMFVMGAAILRGCYRDVTVMKQRTVSPRFY
jgi:hypothetical protein